MSRPRFPFLLNWMRIPAKMPSKPQRLFVTSDLAPGASLELDPAQAHYLINVLRCKTGEEFLLFNGKDGEWLGSLSTAAKKTRNR